MIQTFKNEKNIFKDILCILIILVFYIFLFFKLNIINSGYHIQDDHEILYNASIINKNNFFNILLNYIETDGRFRPIYWLHRTFLFYIFKSNFFFYYLEFFVLGVLSSIFLYFTFRKLSKSYLFSVFILCFLFFGSFMQIFMGLGYGELLSLALLSASLFFMILKNEKYKIFNQLASLFFLVLCMYSKEQFLIAVPFLLLFKVIYDTENNNFINSFKNNILYILTSLILFFIGIIFSYNLMGNDFSSHYIISLKADYLIKSFLNILNIDSVKTYFCECISFLIIIVTGLFFTKNSKIKKYFIYILIMLVFLLSQIIFLSLTPNNDFQLRYMFPALLGPAIILAISAGYFKVHNKLFFYIILIFLIFSSFFNLKYFSFSDINNLVKKNIIFNNYLNEFRKEIDTDNNILLIGSSFSSMEFFESMARYFNYYGYKNIYIFPYIDNDYESLNDFEKKLYYYLTEIRFKNKQLNNMNENAKLIIICDYWGNYNENYKKKSQIDFAKYYKKINKERLDTDFYLLN